MMQNQPQPELDLGTAACLFVPKNKEEQALLRSSSWVSYCWCQGTFFRHVQRFPVTDSIRKRQETEQGTGWGCEKEWNMCRRQEWESSASLRISQWGDMREAKLKRHEAEYRNQRINKTLTARDWRWERRTSRKPCYTERGLPQLGPPSEAAILGG